MEIARIANWSNHVIGGSRCIAHELFLAISFGRWRESVSKVGIAPSNHWFSILKFKSFFQSETFNSYWQ